MGEPAKTYIIEKVSDFLLVPEDRLDECLREFRIMLQMARPSADLLGHVADEMAAQGKLGPLKPGDVRFRLVDRFEWIDDGLSNVTMRVGVEPGESSARREARRP